MIVPIQKSKVKLWIFGSRARGNHHKFSDIDILYDLSEAENISPAFISKIYAELEDSDIPYKINLVNNKELAKSYKENIMRERIPIT